MVDSLTLKSFLFRCGLSGFASVLVVLLAQQSGRGGDFHQVNSLVCSDCHVMHYSETHSLVGPTPPEVQLAPGGPFAGLLRQPASELCLACHDSRTTAPDVLGANFNPYIRAAGGLNKTGNAGEYAEGNGHTLGSVSAAPGGSWTGNQTGGLECKHCHGTHGNPYYRNLTPNPGTTSGKFVTYLTGSAYSGTKAIQQLVATPMSSHYAVSNILYRQSQVGTTDFGLSEWCGGCHGDYHGIGGSANMGGSPTGDMNSGSPWLRHPTRDVTMAQGVTNKHIDRNHWFSSLASRAPIVSPSGVIPGLAGSSDNQVFCGSCHKAHGSSHRAGLIYDDETTATPEDGTSLMQTCQQCHFQ